MADQLVWFENLSRTDVAIAGGKGANLGELSRLAEVRVPAGVCVTTAAFRRMLAAADSKGGIGQAPRSAAAASQAHSLTSVAA